MKENDSFLLWIILARTNVIQLIVLALLLWHPSVIDESELEAIHAFPFSVMIPLLFCFLLLFSISNIFSIIWRIYTSVTGPLSILVDILLFSIFIVAYYTQIYRVYGITYNANCVIKDSMDCIVPTTEFLTHLYFSIVTFTTLGYGEYIPSNSISQIFAGVEALLGLFHLGLLAGIVFHAGRTNNNS